MVENTEKFEYMSPKFNGQGTSKIIEELNRLGEEGWELVGNIYDSLNRPQYILKRKKYIEIL